MRGTLLALACACCASPALAQDRSWDVDGWTVGADLSDKECLMGMNFEGPGSTSLALAQYAEGQFSDGVLVTINNGNWSTTPGKVYSDVSFEVDGLSYEGPAVGTRSESGGGLAMLMPKSFLGKVSEASWLFVWRGDKLADKLSLEGSAASVQNLGKCMTYVRQFLAKQALDEARWKGIEQDPFASEKKSGTVGK